MPCYSLIMVSAICEDKPTTRVNGTDVPTEIVRERLLSLDCNHIHSVLHGLWEVSGTDIGNPRAYRLTALFNAAEAEAI